MNTALHRLLALQEILLRGDKASAVEKAQVPRLTKAIQPSMLEHCYHQLACDRRTVAFVRNGVCGACHIRLPSATLYDLMGSDDVLLCENCGCYVALPAEEAQTGNGLRPAPTLTTPKQRKRGKLVGT